MNQLGLSTALVLAGFSVCCQCANRTCGRFVANLGAQFRATVSTGAAIGLRR